MKKSRSAVAVLSVIVLSAVALAPPALAAEKKKRLGEGDGVFRPVTIGALMQVPFQGRLTGEERAYLGLPGGDVFTLADIKADLLFIEFFNTSCYACALMAPVMGQAWARVEAREDLRGRVRFLGVGVGNTPEQVQAFRDQYRTPFPEVTDPDLAAFDALGNAAGTPYLLLLRSGKEGPEARGQVGYISETDRVVAEIAAALQGVATAPTALPMENVGSDWRNLKPPISGDELAARLTAAAAEAGLAGATVTPVTVSTEETFYRLASGGRHLWAAVAGRAKICNVCHDIFFILLFDDAGRVVNVAPIHITKYKNVEFDATDIAFLKGRVIGRFLTQEISFDPRVDAVSAATMSSKLVFDTLRRLRETYRQMVKSGTIPSAP